MNYLILQIFQIEKVFFIGSICLLFTLINYKMIIKIKFIEYDFTMPNCDIVKVSRQGKFQITDSKRLSLSIKIVFIIINLNSTECMFILCSETLNIFPRLICDFFSKSNKRN